MIIHLSLVLCSGNESYKKDRTEKLELLVPRNPEDLRKDAESPGSPIFSTKTFLNEANKKRK